MNPTQVTSWFILLVIILVTGFDLWMVWFHPEATISRVLSSWLSLHPVLCWGFFLALAVLFLHLKP